MAIYSTFAILFDYPGTEITLHMLRCVSMLETECPESAALLRKFQLAIAGKSLGELQELYTATFDMRPDCAPALGYHLFGDDTRRSLLLIQLSKRLEAHHINAGVELPDHLSLVLRLMDSSGPGEECDTLATECLAPALARMTKALGQSAQASPPQCNVADEERNPYLWALQALLAYVERKDARVAAAR